MRFIYDVSPKALDHPNYSTELKINWSWTTFKDVMFARGNTSVGHNAPLSNTLTSKRSEIAYNYKSELERLRSSISQIQTIRQYNEFKENLQKKAESFVQKNEALSIKFGKSDNSGELAKRLKYAATLFKGQSHPVDTDENTYSIVIK